MEIGLVSVVGAVFALVAALVLTVLYFFLVPLKDNRGGKLFVTMLLVVDSVLGLNAARALLGDYAWRIPLLTVSFYVFGFVLVAVSVMLWQEQRDGARKRRKE